MQWKPSMEEDEGGGGNDGWAVVDAVAYKNDNASETGITYIKTSLTAFPIYYLRI